MGNTLIDWTDKVWNPCTGCEKISPECRLCYAEVMANRLKGIGHPHYRNGFNVTIHPDALNIPFGWKGNVMCFLPSMGDLFHKDVPDDFIDQVICVVEQTPNVTYQLLTKRSGRLKSYFTQRRCAPNLWLGVTCGHKDSIFRVDDLRDIAAPVRFVSAEPLLGDLANEGLILTGIDWIIVGGESGGIRARPMDESWAMNLKQLADACGTTFFFKQWGSWGVDNVRRSKSANGHLLGGVEYHNYPTPRLIY
ncbi:MAG: phage Gp37/Gp68 family protein [Muribaculaceae bacterium]|nr:phage Gp37/Gp68 family protein [Muribaculaceae bacterium]